MFSMHLRQFWTISDIVDGCIVASHGSTCGRHPFVSHAFDTKDADTQTFAIPFFLPSIIHTQRMHSLGRVLSLYSCLAVCTAGVGVAWRHDWTTVGDMIFAHGGNNTVVSEQAHEFLAAHYPIVAFADCYGNDHGRGVTQEEAALTSATKLRVSNPSIKNVIYFKSHLESQLTSW
jgi:hypothetical protein